MKKQKKLVDTTSREYEIEQEANRHFSDARNIFYHAVTWADEHPVNKWVSAHVRLPEVPENEKFITVLITDKEIPDVFETAHFWKGHFIFRSDSKVRTLSNLYWMYIPVLKIN